MKIEEFYERYWELIKYRDEFILPKTVLNAYDEKNIYKSDTFNIIKRFLSESPPPIPNSSLKILDVGAGDRRMQISLEKMGIDCIYKSLDISKNVAHDYRNINSVDEKFDVVMMFELVEHLKLEYALNYLSQAFELLNEGGILFLSTPNIEHINQLWKHDVTHIRQYPAKDLYSILRMIGFSNQIKVYRINLRPFKMKIKQMIIEKVRILLNKFLGTDYAHGILMIAKKHAS